MFEKYFKVVSKCLNYSHQRQRYTRVFIPNLDDTHKIFKFRELACQKRNNVNVLENYRTMREIVVSVKQSQINRIDGCAKYEKTKNI